MAAAGTRVADIVDDSGMKLTVPFIADTAGGLYVGQSASVSIVGTFYTLDGAVSKISTGNLTTDGGNSVRMVEITVPNPGTLKKGDKGTAVIGGVAANDAGEFDYIASSPVIAEAAGKVVRQDVIAGDKVSAGTAVLTLENEAMTNQQQQNALAIKDASLSLDNLQEQLKNYNLTSKINGTVIKKNVDKNDALSAANMGSMAVVADLSKIIVKVKVDEMDAPKIQVGKVVTLTADADPEQVFGGRVEFIGETATAVNGVALYEVKLTLDDPGRLMPGMNVTAKITLD
ncbi:hypothetical protein FACS189492_1740 [Clostridia bacterium]|nr:hypothetical protein FACS189492_1740 [Clostridia bacterium]